MAKFEVDLPGGTVTVEAADEMDAYNKALRMQAMPPVTQPQPQMPQAMPQAMPQEIPQSQLLTGQQGQPAFVEPTRGAFERLGTGMQKRVGEIQRGLTGAFLRGGEMIGAVAPESVQQYEQAVSAERANRSVMDAPRSAAEVIGGVMPDVALGLGAGGALRTAGRALGTVAPRSGAALETLGQSIYAPSTVPQAMLGGAIYGQTMPYASGREAVVGTGATALAGGVAQPVLRAAGLTGQPQSQLPQAQQEAARRAIEAGFEFPVSEMTGSATGRFLGEGLKALPFGRSAYDAMATGNQKTVNTIVNRSIGLPANVDLTPNVLQQVKDQAFQAYDNLTGIPSIKLDRQFGKIVDGLINTLSAGAKSTRKETGATNALKVLEDYKGYVTSGLDGEGVKQNLRALTDLAFKSGKEGKIASEAYKTLREEFENAVDRSLLAKAQSGLVKPDLIDKYRDARTRLANVFVVENAFDEATGKVSGKKIASALSKRSGYGTRGTDLETAALASEVFPSMLPSSGTAERTQAANLLNSAFSAGAGGAGMYGLMQDPLVAGLAVGSLGGPFVASQMATAKPIRDVVARRQLGAIPPDESKIAAGMRLFEERIPEPVRYGLGGGTRALLERYLNRGLLGE